MTKETNDFLIRNIRGQQEHIKEALRNPDVRTPEVRSMLSESLLKLEEQVRELKGDTRMHKKGGMVKGFSPIARPQKFKGVF